MARALPEGPQRYGAIMRRVTDDSERRLCQVCLTVEDLVRQVAVAQRVSSDGTNTCTSTGVPYCTVGAMVVIMGSRLY